MSATNRGRKRIKNDFYPTSGWVVDELLAELKPDSFRGYTFLEPCRGDGVIYDRVKALHPFRRTWCELSEGRDYLKRNHNTVQIIITNPPFSLAREFLEKSLREAEFVAYLMRINFLGSQCRHEWWQGMEPTHLFALSRRPSFAFKGTDQTDYAWFVWDGLNLCVRKPGIYAIWNTKNSAIA